MGEVEVESARNGLQWQLNRGPLAEGVKRDQGPGLEYGGKDTENSPQSAILRHPFHTYLHTCGLLNFSKRELRAPPLA
jgi:hypothetical protein